MAGHPLPWEHWGRHIQLTRGGGRASIRKVFSCMPFLKDEERLAWGREGKVLQEEKRPLQRQRVMGMDSVGQDGAEGKCEDI